MAWMSHKKMKEIKRQPGKAGTGNIFGCCLVSLHILCDILSIHSVHFESLKLYGHEICIRLSCLLEGLNPRSGKLGHGISWVWFLRVGFQQFHESNIIGHDSLSGSWIKLWYLVILELSIESLNMTFTTLISIQTTLIHPDCVKLRAMFSSLVLPIASSCRTGRCTARRRWASQAASAMITQFKGQSQ